MSRDGTYVDYLMVKCGVTRLSKIGIGSSFGELEYHGAGLDAAHGPGSLSETDTIWAFGGSADSIAAVGAALPPI